MVSSRRVPRRPGRPIARSLHIAKIATGEIADEFDGLSAAEVKLLSFGGGKAQMTFAERSELSRRAILTR